MFSVNVFCAKRDFPPKNGPVPIQTVNAYQTFAMAAAKTRYDGMPAAPATDKVCARRM